MYSRSTGYPLHRTGRSALDYRQGVRIPSNYSGTAIGTPPPDGVPPATDGVALPEVTTDNVRDTQEPPPKAPRDESDETAKPTAVTPTVASPLSGVIAGRHFPFGHGIGFEELLILGIIFCLLREGDAGEGDDLSMTVLLLGALLFLG